MSADRDGSTSSSVGLGRGRRGRRRGARRPRPERAPPGGGPAPHGGGLHALGGEGEPRLLVAAAVRADRRGRRRRRRAPRRAVRGRDDDDQHEGRAARGRPRLREVARGERPRRSSGGAPFGACRPRSALRPRRAAARRPRPVGLAQERLHRRARLPRARLASRAGARVHGRELHELRLVPAGLPDERRQVDDEHLHPRRVGDREARAPRRGAGAAGRRRGRGGEGRRVRRRRRLAPARRRGRRGRRRRARSTRRSSCCAPACRTARARGSSAATSASIRCASSTGSSTSRRTRTWSTRSPPTRWTTSATRTAAS